MNGRQRAAHPSRVKVTGPLAGYADGFRRHLAERGYHPQVIGRQALLMANLSTWLEARGFSAGTLTPEAADDFVRDRRESGRRELASSRALGPLLGYLRGLGAVPSVAEQAPGTPAEALLAEFASYLTRERGLSPMSVSSYARHSRPFVTGLGEPLKDTLAGLSAAQVTGFMTSRHPQWGRGTAQATVTALRALLRFLHAAGHVPEPLAGAVPAVAHWQLTALPAGVSPDHVTALLASCDRRSASGRRDYAILMLLSRLGLRAGEAAAAELGDVDWKAGQIAVRGKGRRTETLPLPADVGEALADYVQHARPRCAGRPLLVILHAPYTGLTRAHVLATVYRACDRAGLTRFGAHKLRHAVACELLRNGASLAEVGQLLRHRDEKTTAIYAKVDIDALRALARPCPEAGAL
jgi:site-specific recombinase XerD